jgi:hypothetical protein
MGDEKRGAFLAYMLAWLTTELFVEDSVLYDNAFEEIQNIERTGGLSRCQLRIARKIAQANCDNARVMTGF